MIINLKNRFSPEGPKPSYQMGLLYENPMVKKVNKVRQNKNSSLINLVKCSPKDKIKSDFTNMSKKVDGISIS